MPTVGRTESSAPTASRVSASSVPHRFICHRTIVAATAAFNDSQRGDMGMMIFCSAAANSSGQIPCPSLPDHDRRIAQICLPQINSVGRHGGRQQRDMRFPAGGDGLLPRHADRLGGGTPRPWRRGPSWGYTCRRSRPAARPEPPARPPCGESCRDCRGPECRPAEASPAGSCGLPLRQAAEEDRALRRVHQRDGLHHIPGYTDNAHGI